MSAFFICQVACAVVEYISEGHKLAWPSNIQYFSELQSALEIIQYIKAVSILFPQPLAVFFCCLVMVIQYATESVLSRSGAGHGQTTIGLLGTPHKPITGRMGSALYVCRVVTGTSAA